MLMMMVWSVGDSGTALGDISPAPFCPITRLLCGHRALKPMWWQYHNIPVLTWCYRAWPGGKI